jgi:hypothetical protein
MTRIGSIRDHEILLYNVEYGIIFDLGNDLVLITDLKNTLGRLFKLLLGLGHFLWVGEKRSTMNTGTRS